MKRRDLLKTFTAAGVLSTFGANVPAEENPKPVKNGLLNPDGWTMVVIPDPQSYVKYSRNQGIFELMTAWIAENIQKFNIQQVLITGDLVEQNNIGCGQYNQTSEQMWKATSRALERLDGVTPYIICTGNHDYGFRDSENRETQVNDYFPSGRNPAWNGVLKEMGENTFGKKTLENAAYEFTTAAGRKMLTISLPFAPTDANLAWAKELAAREEYANHFVTILTHSFIKRGGVRPEAEHYALNKAGGNAGEAIWQKLVFPSPNIRLVVNGHFSGPNSFADSTAFRMDENQAGKPVAQMLFDVQALGGGWNGNGSDGWIRLLEFNPDLTHVSVRTFSPLFDISPDTKKLAWELSDLNDFEFQL